MSKAKTTSQCARIKFVTNGKTAMIYSDGSGFKVFEFDFDVPNQASWQYDAEFPDGRRTMLLSLEPQPGSPGGSFSEYYHKTQTHIWIYDLKKGGLTEIATRDRLAPFYAPQLLLHNGRMLVQLFREDDKCQIYNMNLDGSDAHEFTGGDEGVPYGFSLSPDGKRVAFHLARPSGYQIWTSDTDGTHRTLVAFDPEHLYFGPSWSPDGKWLMFQDCHHQTDPGHDWSDICLARPDGSEKRLLTKGQLLWFGASYGNPQKRGGGSNGPVWTHDGTILAACRLPDSKVAWEYQSKRPDTDHFNRDYKPELARGGTEICRIDPRTGAITPLTKSNSPVWDFRQSESPDGKHIVFCRAKTGGQPAIWIMDSTGDNPRQLTTGLDNSGADHPGFLLGPAPTKATR